MARVWVDLTNTAHVVVLRPLVELLEAAGHEVVLTARPLSHTVELLDDWGHPYTAFGEHGGARRADKARAALSRARADGRRSAARTGRSTRRSRTARPTCRSPRGCCGIPNTTMFDYEFAIAQHTLNGRLAHRVLVPEAIPPERLRRFGMRGRRSSCATRA